MVPCVASDRISGLETVVVTPFQQNCSILFEPSSRAAVVVDPGGDVPLILERLSSRGLAVEAILLTHGHLDHAGGVETLREALAGSGVQVPVIGPEQSDAFLLSSVSAQAALFGLSGMRDARADRFVREGEVLTLAGRRLEVLCVPGHTPGHVVFLDRAASLLIAGDTLFAGSVGRTDFPYADGPLLLRGIRDKLMTLPDDILVFPGHGTATSIGAERAANPFLRQL